MFKYELGGKIMKEFCALRAKTKDDDSEKKKANGIKRCVIRCLKTIKIHCSIIRPY